MYKNHFIKNIEITKKKVIDNFLLSLDKEKITFTSDEYNFYSSNVESIYDLEEIFKIYDDYSKRSLELISYQLEMVNRLENLGELNTTEFVEKDREDAKRFDSLKDIKNYHHLLLE